MLLVISSLGYGVLLAYLALLGRILLLGYEKIALKQLSNDQAEETTVLYFVLALPFLIPLLFLCELPSNYNFLPFIAICSLIYAIAFSWFVKALTYGEASQVSPLYDFNLFFVAILSWVFLDELLTISKIFGLILLIIGSSFLDRQHNLKYAIMSVFKNQACRYMIGCSFLVAIGRIVDGILLKQVKLDPILYTFFLYFGISFWIFLKACLNHKLASTKILFQQHTKISLIVGMINAYAYCLLAYAFTQIDISIAQALSMLSMIVTMILARFILQEEIGRRSIGAVLMLSGAWIILLSR